MPSSPKATDAASLKNVTTLPVGSTARASRRGVTGSPYPADRKAARRAVPPPRKP